VSEKPRGTKQPKHFKVHCSLQNHRKTVGIYDDDALLAMYTRIGIMAVERYADKTGDSFICSGRDLERLAGGHGVANARRKLGRLEAAGGPAVCQEGAGYRLTFRNFAKKQGFGNRLNQKRESPSSSSSTATATATKEREREAPPAPSEGSESAPDPGQLVNVLSPFDGDLAEKRAWLDHEWPLIHAEAQADPKPGRVVPIAIRFYRAYLTRGPEPGRPYRKFEKWAEKQATRRAVAEHEAKFAADIAALEAEEGYAAAHR